MSKKLEFPDKPISPGGTSIEIGTLIEQEAQGFDVMAARKAIEIEDYKDYGDTTEELIEKLLEADKTMEEQFCEIESLQEQVSKGSDQIWELERELEGIKEHVTDLEIDLRGE